MNVGAYIYQALEHATVHTAGEVGAETRRDLACQGEGSLSVPRLNELGVYQNGPLARGDRTVIAGSKWRHQQRHRERGTQGPRHSRRGRTVYGAVHGASPVNSSKLNRIVYLQDRQAWNWPWIGVRL